MGYEFGFPLECVGEGDFAGRDLQIRREDVTKGHAGSDEPKFVFLEMEAVGALEFVMG